MSRARPRFALLAVLTMFACVMTLTVGGPSSGADGQDETIKTAGAVSAPSETPADDTASFTRDLGVTSDEVKRQTALQEAMDRIPFDELDPGYAEDGSQMGKNFELWYRSAHEPSDKLLDAMKAAGVLEYVRFERVPLSLVDLIDQAKVVERDLLSRDVPVGVTIDTALGGVILHPYDEGRAGHVEAELAADRANLPFRWGDPPPTPTNRGGRPADMIYGNCTGGFTVQAATGGRRMTSAGHCGIVNGSVIYAGESGFQVQTKHYDNFHDVLTFSKSGESWGATVEYTTAGGTRTVTALRSWAAMDVGDAVTKYGRTTGYTAGTIENKHECAPAGCSAESMFVRVDPDSPYPDMCLPGDSGGPNMYNNTAYGFTSGRIGSDCVYMPQQLNAWGSVLTQ